MNEHDRHVKARKEILAGGTPEKRIMIPVEDKESIELRKQEKKEERKKAFDRLEATKDARTPWFCPSCEKVMKKNLDDKMWRLYGHCFDCQVKIEHKMRLDNTYDEWEQDKIKANKKSYIDEMEQMVVEWRKLTEEKIEEMTAVNDRRHSETTQSGDVIVNLALACSVRDLYQQCKANAIEKGVTEENIPSLSWFRFQFWPRSSYLATALNYTGRFNVRFMVQQRNIRKFSVDAHYCNALFKYSKELAIRFSNYCLFVSTNDKCKIKIGEPNFPVAAVARGKRVLVAKNQVFQVADHDLSSVTLIPTVGLMHEIPDEVDKS